MEKPASEILADLGEIMDRFGPIAILDKSMLPAPKPVLKAMLREVWKAYPPIREAAEAGYMAMAQFQDGVGPDPAVMPTLQKPPPGANLDMLRREAAEFLSGPTGTALDRWLTVSRLMMSETEVLAREWRAFVEGKGT